MNIFDENKFDGKLFAAENKYIYMKNMSNEYIQRKNSKISNRNKMNIDQLELRRRNSN